MVTQEENWLEAFPELATLESATQRRLADEARPVTLPAGTTVFHDGDACSNYLLVLDGTVRVQKISSSGREITLYRVGDGQTCILTTTCLLSGERYPAEGITETEVRAIVLGNGLFQALLAESPGFRQFVFAVYARRVTDLIVLVEEVAFGRMDLRLASRLRDSADASGMVAATHQELAAELGSAREVVSRLLKDFEQRGLVALHRGRVELLDRTALDQLADS
ncbi:MAG: Crp/Fnr family transcriptional regulator [Gammaproteobacteria bacterium]|nr:MAG: Crp/Fnr family transcriptional regulator [Gammaproteobacteria bacterium]